MQLWSGTIVTLQYAPSRT